MKKIIDIIGAVLCVLCVVCAIICTVTGETLDGIYFTVWALFFKTDNKILD